MSNDEFRTAEVRTALRHSSFDILRFCGSKRAPIIKPSALPENNYSQKLEDSTKEKQKPRQEIPPGFFVGCFCFKCFMPGKAVIRKCEFQKREVVPGAS